MDKSSRKENISQNNPNKKTVCEVCKTEVIYIFVHGHYQCPICKQIVVSCCEGDPSEYSKPKNGN